MTKTAYEMTVEELMAVKLRKWNEETICWSVVIIPLDTTHDSGYRNMLFVAIDGDGYPIHAVSGISDVIHFDGISCNNSRFNNGEHIESRWNIDCLPNGLLRIFSSGKQIVISNTMSSMEIFTVKPSDKNRARHSNSN